jgi:signal transduction histidine kinase
MIPNVQSDDAKWVMETYFSNPDRVIRLNRGDILLKEDQVNKRLYLVKSGRFSGTVTDEDGNEEEAFRVFHGTFIGLHSFFSGSFISIATVRAISDSEVVYMERDDDVIPYKGRTTLEEQFMPLVIFGLVNRQQSELSLFKEKEATYKKLLEHEKQASLGKMAAGIAHELNNAVAVLYSSANWLIEKIAFAWKGQKETALFEAGLLSGRHLSSREKRELQKMWQSKHGLSSRAAKALAQTGMPEKTLLHFNGNLEEQAERLNMLWEIGASLNDMRTASQHAKHVVKSVKLLGAQSTDRRPIDINESIDNALALLNQKIKTVNLESELGELPQLTANMGEMVQVWLNIIKNAIEALNGIKSDNPKIKIKSLVKGKEIIVDISDNGPGIPKKLQQAIFEPDVTTKKSGMSFGLGLGLAIVKRIISSYQGKVKLICSDAGTTFKISLPLEY